MSYAQIIYPSSIILIGEMIASIMQLNSPQVFFFVFSQEIFSNTDTGFFCDPTWRPTHQLYCAYRNSCERADCTVAFFVQQTQPNQQSCVFPVDLFVLD